MAGANGDIPGGIYCRKCGYDLRGQAGTHRCPECGRRFDPASPKTFLLRPPRGTVWRWIKPIVFLLLLLVLMAGICWSWLYWGWRKEQAAMAKMTPLCSFGVNPLGGKMLRGCLGSAGWILDRTTVVTCGPKTTDADLIYLKDLTRLKELGFYETQVTDAGLVHIKELDGLQWLNLNGTRVTATGVKDLQTALPATQIHWP